MKKYVSMALTAISLLALVVVLGLGMSAMIDRMLLPLLHKSAPHKQYVGTFKGNAQKIYFDRIDVGPTNMPDGTSKILITLDGTPYVYFTCFSFNIND